MNRTFRENAGTLHSSPVDGSSASITVAWLKARISVNKYRGRRPAGWHGSGVVDRRF
jgi:hypothetical protein